MADCFSSLGFVVGCLLPFVLSSVGGTCLFVLIVGGVRVGNGEVCQRCGLIRLSSQMMMMMSIQRYR